jgi:hypothetical protein
MLFTHTWEKILSGEKTQTRRIRKPEHDISAAETCIFAYRPYRILWEVGHKYAVQPGRGQKNVGHIRITSLRCENIQDITEADAIAEGCAAVYHNTAREVYARLWNTVHKVNPANWWDENPQVWVLTFELVKG